MKRTPELLLPVGNSEMAMAAIHNGADAIYLGFPGFNARGRTVDFEINELKELIETCHLYGVKVNLALNILIFQNELDLVVDLLEKVLPLKADAFIVQDLGLLRLIRKMSPDQVIHASTQMTVTNHEAISFLDDLNIKRFVLARENSLDEISLIKAKTTKELEVFVHGALCVSYSGQCFTSESIGGRSANRGQCAQSCRLSYDLYVDGELHKNSEKKFVVSPQDLCGIHEIPELMDMGIESFKIEGRLKTPEYVAQSAREYRDVINKHLKNQQKSLKELDFGIQKMAITYSRGFFSGWLHGVNHQKLVDGTFSAHRGYRIGLIVGIKNDIMQVQLDETVDLKPGDGLLWAFQNGKGPQEDGAQIYEIRQVGSKNWEVKFSNDKRLRSDFIGAKLYINSNSDLSHELRKSYENKNLKKRILVSINISLEVNNPVRATITDGIYTCEAKTLSLAQVARNQGLSDDFLKGEMSALGGTVYTLDKLTVQRHDGEPLFCTHKELKILRRELTDKLSELRSKNSINTFSGEVLTSESVKNWMSLIGRERQILKSRPRMNVLLREKGQVDDFVKAWDEGRIHAEVLDTVILDFEFGRDFAPSVDILKSKGIRCGIATTRILKPQEYQNLKAIEKINPDVILVRNLGALHYYTQISAFSGDLIGDFSLNVTNHLTAGYLLSKGLKTVCASYDLNRSQVNDLLAKVSGSQIEVTVHQYMPSFHMEHCVFAAYLSQGTSFKDCGKPCEKHQVELRDQFGNTHQIKPDQECRNTMYNAVSASAARFISEWRELGLGWIRYEALRERGEDLVEKILGYQNLLLGRKTEGELLTSLQLFEKYGLGEGAFMKEKKYQDRKKDYSSKKSTSIGE